MKNLILKNRKDSEIYLDEVKRDNVVITYDGEKIYMITIFINKMWTNISPAGGIIHKDENLFDSIDDIPGSDLKFRVLQ